VRTIRSGCDCYQVNDQGEISRDGVAPSGDWLLLGAVTRNNLGGITRHWTLADILRDPSAIPWQWKNSKQHTFIRDLDHGTIREWRRPTHDVR